MPRKPNSKKIVVLPGDHTLKCILHYVGCPPFNPNVYRPYHHWALDLMFSIQKWDVSKYQEFLGCVNKVEVNGEDEEWLYEETIKEVFNALCIIDTERFVFETSNQKHTDKFIKKYAGKRYIIFNEDGIMVTKNEAEVNSEKESGMSNSKFSGKKVAKKKAVSKKKTGKKVATKKAVSKKKVSKASTGKKTASKKKVSKAAPGKKTASKKKSSDKAAPEVKGTIMKGEGTPAMEARKEILEMVPAGKRGIKMSSLVEKIVDELETTEKRAINHVTAMVSRGFIEHN